MTPSRYRRWLTVALLVVTIVGLAFRLIGLQKRMYWTDECFTLNSISGFTLARMDGELTERGVCAPSDVLFYQEPHGGMWQTIQQLMVSAPEQTPLYFVLGKLTLLSSSVRGAFVLPRVVSCVAGTALILLAYWLSRELGTSRSSAVFVAALVAISPFQVHLAQEARLYALWTALIFFSSACLVRAMRLNSRHWWICYSLSITLCLYTMVLSVVVIAAHFLFVSLSSPMGRIKSLTRMTLASAFSITLFLPWVFGVSQNWDLFQDKVNESSRGSGLAWHLRVWLEAASYLVGDVMDHGGLPRARLNDLAQCAIAIFAALLLVYAAYRIARYGPRGVRRFIFSAWVAAFLMLVVPDLLFGGGRSAKIRYLIPAFGFGNLAIALALWAPPHGGSASRCVRFATLLVVCMLSVMSLYVQSDRYVTWNRRGSAHFIAMAEAINASDCPLVVIPRQGVSTLVFSHLLDDHVRILVFEPPLRTIPQRFGSYFYYSGAEPPPFDGTFAHSEWKPMEDLIGTKATLWRLEQRDDKKDIREGQESGMP